MAPGARLQKPMMTTKVMYRCESWTKKKAGCQRIDGFELWCWRRLLTFPWTARGSNQSVRKEINPDAGKDGRREEKREAEYEMVGRHHCLNGHESEQTLGDSEGRGSLACCSP